MPSCDEVRGLLSPLLDAELAGDERAAVEGHLTACAGCSEEWALLQASMEVLNGLPQLELDPALIDETVLLAAERPAPPQASGFVALSGAAAALLLGTLTLALVPPPEGSSAPTTPARTASSKARAPRAAKITPSKRTKPRPVVTRSKKPATRVPPKRAVIRVTRPPRAKPSLTQVEARLALAAHTALVEPFAEQVATLEGLDPALDLAVVDLVSRSVRLRARTDLLVASSARLPGAATTYLTCASAFVGAVTSGVRLPPSKAVVARLRDSVARTKVVHTLRAARRSLALATPAPVVSGLQVARVDLPSGARSFALGQLHYVNRDYARAAQHYQAYAKLQPRGAYRAAAHYWLARTSANQGQHELAALNYMAVVDDRRFKEAKRHLDTACKQLGATVNKDGSVDVSRGQQMILLLKNLHQARLNELQENELVEIKTALGAVLLKLDLNKPQVKRALLRRGRAMRLRPLRKLERRLLKRARKEAHKSER